MFTNNKNNQNGFTIVELLVIIVVISILSAVVFVTFSGYRERNRNSERDGDIKLLHTSVEAYFAQNAKYPTLANMNDSTWLASNIKSLESDALKDPQGKEAKLVAEAAPDVYSYSVKASDNTECDNIVKDCAKYILTATYEGTMGTFTRSNLN